MAQTSRLCREWNFKNENQIGLYVRTKVLGHLSQNRFRALDQDYLKNPQFLNLANFLVPHNS